MATEITPKLAGYRMPSGEVTIPLPGSTLEVAPAEAMPVELSGEGFLVTYTIVHVPSTRFQSKAPYALAVVELGAGARLMALVDGATAETLAINARVGYRYKDEFGYHFELE